MTRHFWAWATQPQRTAGRLHALRTVVLGGCVTVCALAYLACGQRRLTRLPSGPLPKMTLGERHDR